MANFLRRLVAKSRSNSPQKGGGANAGPTSHIPPSMDDDDDDQHWAQPSPSTNHVVVAPPRSTQMAHNRRHYGDCAPPHQPAAPGNALHKALPNNVGDHQRHPLPLPPPLSSPKSNRRWSPPSAKAQSPASFRRQQFSAAQQLSAPDEVGTSSQELLSPSLWPSSPLPPSPTQWTMRNSHSNPESAGGSTSHRPPSSTQAAMTRLDELSSLQTLATVHQGRPRSSSPRKQAGKGAGGGDSTGTTNRSRSPPKKMASSKGGQAAKTLDYLHAQCRLEGCSATILVEDSRFLVCKHQLSHSSDFFRTLFLNSHALPMEGVRHVREDEYVVQVSSLRHPPQALQFQWFLETTVPSPMLRDISDDLLETCMRLCKRFAARGLEMRCTKFIKDNVEGKPPLMALCWLNWSFKHHFHRSVQEACLPVVARLSLCQLEKHRQMLPEAVFADLLAMKLRTSYQQASTVFHTIHRMDHFHVDMAQCPRCGRQREQGRVRVQASPCQKLVGCERCMRDYQCELGDEESAAQMQAYWQCEHGLWPFSEKTEDCKCQTALYKANWACGGGGGTLATTTALDETGSAQTRPNRPGTAAGGRFPSNLTLASKPTTSHSSRS